MNSRAVFLSSAAVVVAGAMAVGATAFWLPHHEPGSRSHAHTAASVAHAHVNRSSRAETRFIPTARSRQLQWSPMGALAKLAPPRREKDHKAEVAITRASVPPPLDLKLPASIPRDVASLSPRGSSSASVSNTGTASSVLLLDPRSTQRYPDMSNHGPAVAQDTHLFNRNNGLRGFMARNWLNKNVGLQGGLAIKEDRLRQSSNGLRDNMAVGMGVLLAF